MDPLTLALTLANTVLTFAMRVYDDTPDDIRKTNAAAWAQFIHNIANFILSLQGKINASIK